MIGIRVKFRKDHEDVRDLTRGLFTNALQRDFFGRLDPARASFRTDLRMGGKPRALGSSDAERR